MGTLKGFPNPPVSSEACANKARVSSILPQPIQFGKYTLFERIGRGGMAEVYKGRIQGPAVFERVFVVKRILPHLSEEPTFIRMFVEEAKLSARLNNHPNIVQIFELGDVDGEYFISMEYIRGRDLADTMRAIWKTMGPPRPRSSSPTSGARPVARSPTRTASPTTAATRWA